MSELVVGPSNFFSEDPPERIIGSECEYPVNGALVTPPARYFGHEEDELTEPEASLYFQRGVIEKAGLRIGPNYIYQQSDLFNDVEGIDGGYHFLENGAYVYPDQELLEYASAEALGPTQAAAADFAGTIVMQKLVCAADIEGSQLYRRVGTGHRVDYNETGGYHENYLIPENLRYGSNFYTNKDVLESFLATRTWAMSGMVGESFKLSQKAAGIGNPISEDRGSTMQGAKPIGSFRGGTHDKTIGNAVFDRFEVRYADANLSRWATYMSFATTSLVLRMLEHYDIIGAELDEICLKNVVNPSDSYLSSPLHIIAADMTLKKKFETDGGKKLTAIDIQEKLAKAALKLSKKIALPDDELAAIPEWLQICEDMKKVDAKNHDYSLLADRVDWAARHTYLSERVGGHDKLTRHNNFAVAQDLVWDRIVSKGRGQWYWEKHPERQNVVPQEQIDALVYNPPKNTRASIRGNYIKNCDNISRMSWSSIAFEYPDSLEKIIEMSDAYVYEI